MTDQQQLAEAHRRFGAFGLDGASPAWSSHVLERAFDESSAEAAFRVVFEIFGDRHDLPAPLAQFIIDLVRVSVRLRGADLGGADVTWMVEADTFTPAQALLASYLVPDDRLTAAAVIAMLDALEPTAHFNDVVVELQDVLTSATVAPVIAARNPALADRVRRTLIG